MIRPPAAGVALLCLWLALPATAAVTLVEESPRGVTLELSTDRPIRTRVVLGGRAYERLRFDGFESETAEGAPEIPYARVPLSVPARTLPVWDIDEEAEPIALTLRYDLAHGATTGRHDGSRRVPARDVTAYRKVHGENLVELEELGYAGTDRLAVLKVQPLRYDARRRNARFVPKARIRVRFVPTRDEEQSAAVGGPAGSLARFVAWNRGELSVPLRDPNLKIDLLIAHESHREGLGRLIDFKLKRGRTIREHYVSGGTAAQIKEIIKAEYRSAEPPNSTVLVGSLDQIPSWRGSADNSWTDYPYQNLDGDNLPDIALGRLPAKNPAELDSMVDKILLRETAPRAVDDILLTSGRDKSLGCPANAAKVGDKLLPAAPTIQLIKRFRTEVSTQAVIDGYNGNPNLVVYDGHGNREWMLEIPLSVATLDRLHNATFPILLDIACLNANFGGSGTSMNFARAILSLPGAGMAGILASGGSGMGHTYFQTIASTMAQGRMNLATDTRLNEIARVILVAKLKHSSQDRSYWNYYGDPASSVWESTY